MELIQIEERREEPRVDKRHLPIDISSDLIRGWMLDIDRDKNGQSYNPMGLTGFTFWNYYCCYLSIVVHLVVMIFGIDCWCRFDKFVMFYSFQVVLLHAYSWAIPDRRFAYWVKERRNFFYVWSGLNILFYFMGIGLGSFLYMTRPSGVEKFTGVSIVVFTIFDKTLMVIMFITNYFTLRGRFDYEEIPYGFDPKEMKKVNPQGPLITPEDMKDLKDDAVKTQTNTLI